MASTYSERFVLLNAATGKTLYTVPALKRAILRDVFVSAENVIPNQVWLVLAGAYVALYTFSANYQVYTWSGNQVFYAHEQFGFDANLHPCSGIMSGYLFDDPTHP